MLSQATARGGRRLKAPQEAQVLKVRTDPNPIFQQKSEVRNPSYASIVSGLQCMSDSRCSGGCVSRKTVETSGSMLPAREHFRSSEFSGNPFLSSNLPISAIELACAHVKGRHPRAIDAKDHSQVSFNNCAVNRVPRFPPKVHGFRE